jgi:hypothetical protein
MIWITFVLRMQRCDEDSESDGRRAAIHTKIRMTIQAARSRGTHGRPPLREGVGSGLEYLATPAYSLPMNEIRPPRRRRAGAPSDLAPAGTPLHIAVAPGVLDRKQTVVREPGESDERYQSRCDLLAALLEYAREA